MKTPRPISLVVAYALFFVAGIAHDASADILGFGDFSGFAVNLGDAQSPPVVNGGQIELTTGKSEFRSIFAKAPQNITKFTASFTYQMTNADGRDFAGAAFVIQNSPEGSAALTTNYLAYQGMPDSVAVTLELTGGTGLYSNGTVGGSSVSTSPVNLGSGDPINVTLTYNGTTLSQTLVDSLASATFSRTYLITTPLPTVVGGSTAFVGITAANGAAFGADDQFLSNFQFTAVPEPSSWTLLLFGVAGMLRYLRHKNPTQSGLGAAPRSRRSC